MYKMVVDGMGAAEAVDNKKENTVEKNEDRKVSNKYFFLKNGAEIHKKFEKDRDRFQNRHDEKLAKNDD